MTEYIVQEIAKNGRHLFSCKFEKKKCAFECYGDLCENFPIKKFVVLKRVTSDEKIAESEDHRQTRFDFAK